MTALGVALPAARRPASDDDVLRARDAWAEAVGAPPAYVAVWRSLTRTAHLGPPPERLVRRLREGGSEPVVYLESCERRVQWLDFAAWLSDRNHGSTGLVGWDDPSLIVRIDQEPNGKQFPWSGDARLYREVWQVYRERMRSRLVWCPILHGRKSIAAARAYWPGADQVDIFGFDWYAVKERDLQPLSRSWRAPLALAAELAPGKPVLVCEFGASATLTHRDLWLRSLRTVEGVEGAVYFDLAVASEGTDWRMDEGMRKVAGGLLA